MSYRHAVELTVKDRLSVGRRAAFEPVSDVMGLAPESLDAGNNRGRREMPSIVTTERRPGTVASLAAGAHRHRTSNDSMKPVDGLVIAWVGAARRQVNGSRQLRFISPQDLDLLLYGFGRLVRGRRSEGHVSLAA